MITEIGNYILCNNCDNSSYTFKIQLVLLFNRQPIPNTGSAQAHLGQPLELLSHSYSLVNEKLIN